MDELKEPDYFEKIRQQALDTINFKKGKIQAMSDRVPDTQSLLPEGVVLPNRHQQRAARKKYKGAAEVETLPRYLIRALESGDAGRVEACIDKALSEGWTEERLDKAIDVLINS